MKKIMMILGTIIFVGLFGLNLFNHYSNKVYTLDYTVYGDDGEVLGTGEIVATYDYEGNLLDKYEIIYD